MKKNARVIAFYLPQYHPIPENDSWWGKGFTEWTNVAKAKPMFPGHYQPHLPADFGFYDLRVPEIRIAQAEMANEYGIEGFCYYHYWFSGKRLIERPFNEVLESGEPDSPFCLCWANASWTGIWHGTPNRMLMEQTYPGMEDYQKHFYELLKAFSDDRYITVDGKPLLVIYRPLELPDVSRVLDFWRELALKSGLKGLYIVGISHFDSFNPDDPEYACFDARISQKLPPRTGRVSSDYKMLQVYSLFKNGKMPTLYNYRKVINSIITKKNYSKNDFPCIIPNWDNTPRSGANGLVLHGSSPEAFAEQVKVALHRVSIQPEERRIIFLKSWNEWAEGNHMEPDMKYGMGYLEALKNEISSFQI